MIEANIFFSQERVGQTFSHTGGKGRTNIFHTQGGEQNFYIEGGTNFLVSKASKLSAGARIFRGP